MRISRFIRRDMLTVATWVSLGVLAGGCETPWYEVEPVADTLIPPTNHPPGHMSEKTLSATVGKPCDVQFFGDQPEYMGDADGYRYIHIRDMFDYFGFLGERVYKVPASQWPIDRPMTLTYDASLWRDVTWMADDGPSGVPQNPFLAITPLFPLGAPATQPTTVPATTDLSHMPTPSGQFTPVPNGRVDPSAAPNAGQPDNSAPSTSAPSTSGPSASEPSSAPATGLSTGADLSTPAPTTLPALPLPTPTDNLPTTQPSQ